MKLVNFAQSVVIKAIDNIMFVAVDPTDSCDKFKEELIKFDQEILNFDDQDIKKAISLWLNVRQV